MSKFREVDVFREGEVVCEITEDTRGRQTFMLGKEFVCDGEVRRTPFMAYRHLDAIERILKSLRSKLKLR